MAGHGSNVGITAIGPGFVALANAGPGVWRGEVLVDGQRYALEVPANGYASLEVPSSAPSARIIGSDALVLDNEASFSRRLVRVEVSGRSPALERLLALLGTSRGSPGEVVFEIGTPRRSPSRFTVFFAEQARGQAPVFDVERTLPYLRGVSRWVTACASHPAQRPLAGSPWPPARPAWPWPGTTPMGCTCPPSKACKTYRPSRCCSTT